MKVKKVMTRTVGTCSEEDSLAKAVEIMWQKDCGVVPVINKKSKVVGMITDRDIAVSGFLQNKPVYSISVGEVINGKIRTCSSKDKIEAVLKVMQKRQIKRLPVVKKNGKLEGIISITDILLASENNKRLRKMVSKTIRAIAKPRSIVLNAVEE